MCDDYLTFLLIQSFANFLTLGDSGGPLACQRCDSCDWYIVGVVSYGVACGITGTYSVYTQVTPFEQWILDHIANGVTVEPEQCVRPCKQTNQVFYYTRSITPKRITICRAPCICMSLRSSNQFLSKKMSQRWRAVGIVSST